MIVDQLTKAWLVANLSPGETMTVIGDWVRLVFSQNSGALFGLFRDNAALFGLASLVVVGLIVAYHATAGRSLYLSIALGFLLGGALGNLIDRLRVASSSTSSTSGSATSGGTPSTSPTPPSARRS